VVTLAFSKATQSIPIVFVQITDPVGSGLVASLAHPGGNVTGFGTFEFEMATKWLDLLREIAPGVSNVGVMQFAKSPTWTGQMRTFEVLGQQLGVRVIPAGVQTPPEIEGVFTEISQMENGGIVVLPDTFTLLHRKLIISLAAEHRLPAIYPFLYFAEDGGLVSYGIDLLDIWVRSANYIDRILRGASAADLPVQQPTKFELAINLKTANALGLNIAPTLLARADKVVE
jgi:putative ABC transport system substrate-binding protein